MGILRGMSGNRTLLVALLALTLTQAGGQSRAGQPSWPAQGTSSASCACDPDICCPPPRPAWYFRSDGVILRRDVHGATNVAALTAPANIVLTTHDLDEPFKAGPRVLIGHTFADTPYQLEGSYYWLNDWDASAAVRDTTTNALHVPGNLFSPFTRFGSPAVQGLDYNNFVSIREFSRMDTGELNVLRVLPMPYQRLTASFLIGARHMAIREQFDYYSQSAVPTLLGSTVSLETQTRNDLWGPQIGGLFEFYAEQSWWINFSAKGGILNNWARQATTGTLTSQGTPQNVLLGASGNGTVFIGDLDLTLVCRPTPHLTTRIGYQATWVDGLALASRNFHPDANVLTHGPAPLDRIGKVVYHGPYAGLELSW